MKHFNNRRWSKRMHVMTLASSMLAELKGLNVGSVTSPMFPHVNDSKKEIIASFFIIFF